MEKKKTGLLLWVKKHKKQLILAGVSVAAVVGIIQGVKNKDALEEMWSVLKESIRQTPQPISTIECVDQVTTPILENAVASHSNALPQEPVNVRLHIRTLSGGRTHSAEKAAEAVAMGIELLPNQTLVDPYTKYAA